MSNLRFLNKFSNKSEYDSQKNDVMGLPHVVLLDDTKEVIFTDMLNGYDYVDLGLPSGTLWATSPITNNSNEPLYFQWGDTEGWTAKQVQNREKLFSGGAQDYKWNEGEYQCDGSTMIKYNAIDGKTILDIEDDAAHAHMSGIWHMPTKEQWEELTANTISKWTTQNGVNGRLFTAPNGNSLFMPAFGHMSNGYSNYVGSTCKVWTSSLDESWPSYAYTFNFNNNNLYSDATNRAFGHIVFGVVG